MTSAWKSALTSTGRTDAASSINLVNLALVRSTSPCRRVWGRQPKNSKRPHFRAPAVQTTKIPRKDPKRGKKRTNFSVGEEKKSEILGPPPLRAPTSNPHPSNPHLRQLKTHKKPTQLTPKNPKSLHREEQAAQMTSSHRHANTQRQLPRRRRPTKKHAAPTPPDGARSTFTIQPTPPISRGSRCCLAI